MAEPRKRKDLRDAPQTRKVDRPAAAPAPSAPAKPAAKKASFVLRHGVAVSPGVAIGPAYCIRDVFTGDEVQPLRDAEVLDELSRYDAARERTEADLRALQKKVSDQVGRQQAAIFLTHEAILHDPAFTAKVRGWIVDSKLPAQAALQKLLTEYTELFAFTTDEFLKERLADIRDVIIRLSGHLIEQAVDHDAAAIKGPCILVASELVPSHVFSLGDREVAGIVTESGGRTSHAAILARSRGISAVSGAERILQHVANGDEIIVDGREGHVLVRPDYETVVAYRKLQREFVNLKDRLAENRDEPAVSADGERVNLLANISGLGDAQGAVRMGASGVGLFRTEYLYLTHPDVPDEDEQCRAYREIIDASPNRKITIRTLDVGGDKQIAYIGTTREANPFMGWRSIRLSFEHPQFFLTQIRAVLRAAAPDIPAKKDAPPKQVRLMFPMVTTVEEMRKIRSFIHKAERQLTESNTPFGKIPIGLMLEVPAAVVAIQDLLEEADFVSIGSNDLLQYLMAADRDNPKVSALCEPLSPAVLTVLNEVIGACNAAHKPVTLCGEIAAMPRACVLLFGMGLRNFSMSPAFVPTIKEVIRSLKKDQAERILAQALKFRTASQIIKFMDAQLQAISPKLAILDS
jgi:phosphotransferase system enzyme I (PtsI)